MKYKTTIKYDVWGNKQIHFDNGAFVTLFKGKFQIINKIGVLFEQYATKQLAIARVKKVYHLFT